MSGPNIGGKWARHSECIRRQAHAHRRALRGSGVVKDGKNEVSVLLREKSKITKKNGYRHEPIRTLSAQSDRPPVYTFPTTAPATSLIYLEHTLAQEQRDTKQPQGESRDKIYCKNQKHSEPLPDKAQVMLHQISPMFRGQTERRNRTHPSGHSLGRAAEAVHPYPPNHLPARPVCSP